MKFLIRAFKRLAVFCLLAALLFEIFEPFLAFGPPCDRMRRELTFKGEGRLGNRMLQHAAAFALGKRLGYIAVATAHQKASLTQVA